MERPQSGASCKIAARQMNDGYPRSCARHRPVCCRPDFRICGRPPPKSGTSAPGRSGHSRVPLRMAEKSQSQSGAIQASEDERTAGFVIGRAIGQQRQLGCKADILRIQTYTNPYTVFGCGQKHVVLSTLYGSLAALKMRFRKECWFESGQGHHLVLRHCSDSDLRSARAFGAMLPVWRLMSPRWHR